MSQPFFDPLLGSPPPGEDRGSEPHTVFVDPTLLDVLDRWGARAAQWRARALAELVFGGEVEARLSGQGLRGPFQGLLHLDVPFRGLAEHRDREERFLAAVARDPVLARTPFLYVIGPATRAAGVG